MIEYRTTTDRLTPEQLTGFFVGWPNPPSPETHLQILNGSSHVVIALEHDRVIGFAYAICDGLLAAYIPLLEVLPEFQSRGIGKEIMSRLLGQLGNYYMIDLLCDADLETFYRPLGMQPATGMLIRNYEHQNGRNRE